MNGGASSPICPRGPRPSVAWSTKPSRASANPLDAVGVLGRSRSRPFLDLDTSSSLREGPHLPVSRRRGRTRGKTRCGDVPASARPLSRYQARPARIHINLTGGPMPPPGIPNARIVTSRERAAYRESRAALQKFDPKHPYLQTPLMRLLADLNLTTPGSPWSIDEYGCLTRTIGA